MKHDQNVIADWIYRVNIEGRNLTNWELGFMDSITEQFEAGRPLSESQEEVLERIYANKTK